MLERRATEARLEVKAAEVGAALIRPVTGTTLLEAPSLSMAHASARHVDLTPGESTQLTGRAGRRGIDVEGHAHRALAGAREALTQSRPIVVVAIHSSDEFAGCEAALSPLGYARRRIETHSGSPDEVVGHDFLFSPKK